MKNTDTPGHRFRNAIKLEKPLQVIGAINAYHARLAERSGFNAIICQEVEWRPVRLVFQI